jgi:hypothetical protein
MPGIQGQIPDPNQMTAHPWQNLEPRPSRPSFMGFFQNLFSGQRKDPIRALAKAIFTATHRATEKLRPLGGMEGTEIKKEDFPRYEMLFSELLYFYMHITLRLAHGQH